MKCRFTGLSDPGLVRTTNQDSYYVDPDGRFFLVADGMGGHLGGEEASRLASEIIRTYLDDNWDSSEDSSTLLKTALLKANEAIVKDQCIHPQRGDMGTTVVAVAFREEGKPCCAHVGDSRLYRLRGAKLDQITSDHTWVARAIEIGDLTPDQARVHPWRHVLSQCLGRDGLDQVDVQCLDVQSGDRLLLCSDGLTEELSDRAIASSLKTIRVCERAASALVDAAKDKGGRDNITVIIIAVDDTDASED